MQARPLAPLASGRSQALGEGVEQPPYRGRLVAISDQRDRDHQQGQGNSFGAVWVIQGAPPPIENGVFLRPNHRLMTFVSLCGAEHG